MNSDEKLFSGKYGKQKEGEERKEGEAPEVEPECEESTLGDGRNAYHQAMAILITDDAKDMWLIPYGSIILGVGPHGGRTYRFKFYAGEDLYEVHVEGPQISYALGKLAMGRRATWHPFGAGTKSITVRKVEQPKG